MERIKTEKEWYDNANLLTSIIIGVILVTIIMSQAFAVRNNIGATNILRSLFNHNTTYLLALVYFCFIKSKTGKRYFNLVNILYIALYLLMVLAAFLTIFQSFGIASLAGLLLNFVILFYMIYTFLKGTRYWKEFKLDKAPFDEIKNEWYFYAICVLSGTVLLVHLIGAVNFDGVVLSLFDAIYTILFGRYIYLYKDYEEKKEVTLKNKKRKKEATL